MFFLDFIIFTAVSVFAGFLLGKSLRNRSMKVNRVRLFFAIVFFFSLVSLAVALSPEAVLVVGWFAYLFCWISVTSYEQRSPFSLDFFRRDFYRSKI